MEFDFNECIFFTNTYFRDTSPQIYIGAVPTTINLRHVTTYHQEIKEFHILISNLFDGVTKFSLPKNFTDVCHVPHYKEYGTYDIEKLLMAIIVEEKFIYVPAEKSLTPHRDLDYLF